MSDASDDERRAWPRAALIGTATLLTQGEPTELAIRDLSVSGARLVGPAQLFVGQPVRVRLALAATSLELAAEVMRTEPQNAQVAIAFRAVDAAARAAIEGELHGYLARVRDLAHAAVIVVHADDAIRAALERDLALLGRTARTCTRSAEVTAALCDPEGHVEAVLLSSELADLGPLLRDLAEGHPTVRRVLVFGDQLHSVDHGAGGAVDAVLRTPVRIRALARALGVTDTDSSRGMAPIAGD